MRRVSVLFLAIGVACGACATKSTSPSPSASEATTVSTSSSTPEAATGSRRFRADVWADNWFALYVNGEKVGEDPVSITTERSFNSESISFTAEYPLTIALMAKDYIENDSGLEYIGTDRQQIGDGGVIAQIVDLDNDKVVAVTDSSWKSFVTQTAPLNPECVTSINPIVECSSRDVAAPDGWQVPTFDDSTWSTAIVFGAVEVGPKEGYNDIAWDSSAQFVWGPDLKADNVILLRLDGVSASPKL